MTAGLQVFNTSNFIQVDQDYTNLCLTNKGVSTTSAQAGGYVGSYFDIVVPQNKFMAVKCLYPIALESTIISGTSRIYRYRLPSAPAGTQVNTYEFGPFDGVSAANYGLEIFKSDGSLAFSSSKNYMRVQAVMGVNDYAEILGQVYQLPEGKTYAVMLSSSAGYFNTIALENGTGWDVESNRDQAVVTLSSSSYSVSQMTTYAFNSYTSGSPEERGTGTFRLDFLILDVTGF